MTASGPLRPEHAVPAWRELAALRQRLQAAPTLPAPRTAALFEPHWARMSLAQRLAPVWTRPTAPRGPLNPQALAQRTLQQLQALNPAYLEAFVTQFDALLWLEQQRPAVDTPPAVSRRGKGVKRNAG